MRRALPLLVAVLAASLQAQSRELPRPLPITLTVSLSDATEAFYALANTRIVFRNGARDSVIARTDPVGTAVLSLPAGLYRVTIAPVTWHGRRYRWDVPLDVVRGMPPVELTPQNAYVDLDPNAPVPSRAARGPTMIAGDPTADDARARAHPASPAPQAPKDGTVGVLLSFVIPGAGQMYAGRPGKGVAFLLSSIGAVAGGVAVSANSCHQVQNGGRYVNGQLIPTYGEECGDDLTGVGVGLLVSTGIWIASMVEAPGDVRQWNARHATAFAPVLDRTRDATRLGLAVRW